MTKQTETDNQRKRSNIWGLTVLVVGGLAGILAVSGSIVSHLDAETGRAMAEVGVASIAQAAPIRSMLQTELGEVRAREAKQQKVLGLLNTDPRWEQSEQVEYLQAARRETQSMIEGYQQWAKSLEQQLGTAD